MRSPCQVSTSDGPDGSLNYQYDGAGQLTGVTNPLTSVNNSYSFDANGNPNGSGQNTTTGNELTSDGSVSYTYDHNGNLSTKSYTDSGTSYVWTYHWDFRNRLTQAVETESNATTGATTALSEQMTYDVLGNLIGESVNGTPQFWTVYDGSNPYMELNGSGSLSMHYLANPQGADQLYGRVAASGADPVNWYLTDRQGSVARL